MPKSVSKKPLIKPKKKEYTQPTCTHNYIQTDGIFVW